jgi:tol-pal system protein YbgF
MGRAMSHVVLRFPARQRVWSMVAGLCWAAVSCANAGILEDDEARKAILDLRAKLQQNADANRASMQELQSENDRLRASLLQLNSLLDQVKSDLSEIRGQVEIQAKSQTDVAKFLADLQKQQKDQAQKLDDRFRALEPAKVSLDGQEFIADPAERKMYESALAQFRNGEFAGAQAAFSDFLKRYPQTGYQPAALFWLGNAQYANKQFREALTSFQAIVKGNPNHPKASEALLSAANCQAELKDGRGMRKSLEDLKAKYPDSEAGVAAAERLKKLK